MESESPLATDLEDVILVKSSRSRKSLGSRIIQKKVENPSYTTGKLSTLSFLQGSLLRFLFGILPLP